jgi:hypothetical protein
MDTRQPEENAFSVQAGPADEQVFLRFGGKHRCATISYASPEGPAFAFISPKDGDVYTAWDLPACG